MMNLRYRYLAGTALALSLVAGYAVTQVDATRHSQTSVVAGGADALRVTVDKETGQLRAATAKEAADLRKLEQNAQRNMNSEYLKAAGVLKQHTNGMASIVVDLSNLETVTATVNDDGSVTLSHGDHEIPAAANTWPEE
jgi:hypothetical protein